MGLGISRDRIAVEEGGAIDALLATTSTEIAERRRTARAPIFHETTLSQGRRQIVAPILFLRIAHATDLGATNYLGDDGRVWLSEAAQTSNTQVTTNCKNSGPTFCHFDMNQSTDLASALAAAFLNVVGGFSCAFYIDDSQLQGSVFDRDKINVVYEIGGSEDFGNLKLVGRASDASCPEGHGWYLDPNDPNQRTIRLCPMTCDLAEQDPGATIDIRAGCTTVVTID